MARKKESTRQRGAWGRWRRRRRILKDARLLLRECRRLMRRNSHRLKEDVAEEIRKTASELAVARREKEIESCRQRLEQLDRLLERHLSFARKSAFREYAESIGIAVLIALLLRAFVVEAFKIPSGSMIPTLKVGDHIFVSKFSYGLRIPLTHIKFFSSTPQRGDVIVFIFPGDESKDFIKRIVAVGGDTVEVRKNVLYINGKPVAHRRLPGPCQYQEPDEDGVLGAPRTCVAYEEELDGTHYRVIYDEGAFRTDFAPHKVPDGHVFVMGDNRDNSHDSRAWGTVPGTYIKGRALFIWWSRGPPDGIRWNRFFDLVHDLDRQDPLAPPGVVAP